MHLNYGKIEFSLIFFHLWGLFLFHSVFPIYFIQAKEIFQICCIELSRKQYHISFCLLLKAFTFVFMFALCVDQLLILRFLDFSLFYFHVSFVFDVWILFSALFINPIHHAVLLFVKQESEFWTRNKKVIVTDDFLWKTFNVFMKSYLILRLTHLIYFQLLFSWTQRTFIWLYIFHYSIKFLVELLWEISLHI